MDLFINNFGNGGDAHDITVENNWFDTPGSHAGANSAGYYSLFFDAKGTKVLNQFGRSDRMFTYEVGPLTSWTVVLHDQDTGRGGNGGAIEIAVAPR